MKDYVVGFRISEGRVVLMKKNRPSWQRGLFNGVGGKIEEEETPTAAMKREFTEETGKVVRDWDHFATLETPYATVYFFRSFGDLNDVETTTDEIIHKIRIDKLHDHECVENVKWLLYYAQLSEISHVRITIETAYKVI